MPTSGSVTIGTKYATDASGWTLIVPQKDTNFTTWAAQEGNGYKGDGTRFIYVDPAGNDGNSGTFASPVATPAGGTGNIRNGKPDWILFKQGGVWTGQLLGSFSLHGQDGQNPIVIAGFDFTASRNPPLPDSFSSLARPQFNCSNANSDQWIYLNGGADYLAIMGLEITGAQYCTSTYMSSGMNFLLLENCFFHDNSGGTTGETVKYDGKDVWIRRNIYWNNGYMGIVGGVSNGTNYHMEENLFWHNGWTGDSRNHNLYLYSSGLSTACDYANYQPFFDGNIVSETISTDEYRGGQKMDNNLFVAEATAVNSAGMERNDAFYVTNNVWVEGKQTVYGSVASYSGGNSATGKSAMSCYQGVMQNIGTVTVHDNLFVNGIDKAGAGRAIGFAAGWHDCSAQNNINYNTGQELFIVQGGLRCINNEAGTVTGGSGYNPRWTANITSAVDGSSTVTSGTKLTVDNTGLAGAMPIFFDQALISNASIPALNGVWYVYRWQNNEVWLPQMSFPGTFTGVIDIPWWAVPMKYLTSGAGQNLTLNILVSSIDHTVKHALIGDTDPSGYGGSMTCNQGIGYSAGDVLVPTNGNADIGGVGSGFQLTVGQIGSGSTWGPNTDDPNGTGSHPTWPHPDRTCSKYAQEILGITGGTYTDFLNRAKGQTKQSWNSAYTAKAVNDYIRAGFGITGTTPVISPATVPNGTVGVNYGPVTFTATGGTAPYTWSSSGTIPPGLNFNAAAAQLSGTPNTTTGSPFTFSIRVQDSASTPLSQTSSYTVTIAAAAAPVFLFGDPVLDLGLNKLSAADKVHLCSAMPSDYASVTSTSLGNKSLGAGNVFGAIQSGTGRERVSVAFSGGSITASGTAGYWAAVDSVNSLLLAAGTVAVNRGVTVGGQFSMPAITVGLKHN